MAKPTKKSILELVKDLPEDEALTDEQTASILAALGNPKGEADSDVDEDTDEGADLELDLDLDDEDDEVVEVTARTAAKAKTRTKDDEPKTVTITEAMFSELQRGAKAGETANAEITKTRRDGIIATAFSEGRITREEQKTWRKALDRDETGTVTLLSALTPRFSTSEVGSDQAPDAEFAEGENSVVDNFVTDFAKNFG